MPPSSRTSVTLKDVAAAAGCSKAVASTVLNGSKGNIGVGEAMRQRVVEAAAHLGYRTHFASQSLALRRTRAIGVYIDPHYGGGVGGYYHASVLAGIEKGAADQGYDVLLINFAGQSTIADCIEKIGQSRVDGLLMVHTGRDERLIDTLLEATHHLVAIDSVDPPPRLQAVTYDQAQGVADAVEHLRSLGHRRIGYAGPITANRVPHNHVRRDAFVRATQACGLSMSPQWISMPPQQREAFKLPDRYASSAEFAADQFLSLPAEQRPTAVVAYDDLLAIALLRTLADRGLEVPGEMSLVNFEDTPLSRAVRPQLTCIEHPITDMSRRAASRLIELIESPIDLTTSGETWHVSFPPRLCLRESTAAPSSSSSST